LTSPILRRISDVPTPSEFDRIELEPQHAPAVAPQQRAWSTPRVILASIAGDSGKQSPQSPEHTLNTGATLLGPGS
jgi:hypothetical protein